MNSKITKVQNHNLSQIVSVKCPRKKRKEKLLQRKCGTSMRGEVRSIHKISVYLREKKRKEKTLTKKKIAMKMFISMNIRG